MPIEALINIVLYYITRPLYLRAYVLKRYDNTIYKRFLKSKKTIKVTLSSTTRIRLIIYSSSSLINVWYGSYLGPRRLLRHRGKTCNLQEENPAVWGRKNPMSHLSRMKNPSLPCPSVAAALRAYGYVLSSLDVRTPWEPLLPSLAYPS